jgi:hypothetical protein
MAVKTSMLVATGMLLAACTADAAVLCTTKSGTVKLRPTACKRKETKVDPAAVGLPLANVVDVPNFNVGNLDILTVPGFGTLIVQNGGCATLVSIEAASPAWVNGTGADQDVSTFSFGPNSGSPASGLYAVAAPGAETSVGGIGGRVGYLTFRVQQRTSAAQATIDVFFANGGDAGSVCKVSARAVVTQG